MARLDAAKAPDAGPQPIRMVQSILSSARVRRRCTRACNGLDSAPPRFNAVSALLPCGFRLGPHARHQRDARGGAPIPTRVALRGRDSARPGRTWRNKLVARQEERDQAHLREKRPPSPPNDEAALGTTKSLYQRGKESIFCRCSIAQRARRAFEVGKPNDSRTALVEACSCSRHARTAAGRHFESRGQRPTRIPLSTRNTMSS